MIRWTTWMAAWASDVEVGPGLDEPELQRAIDAAAPGDRIVVYPGTWAGIRVDPGADLEILAVDPGTVVLEPVTWQGAAALDVGGRVTLRGIVLDGLGAGLPLQVRPGGAVTVEDGELRDGATELDGGCALLDTGAATLRRTAVQRCSAGRNGGGLYAASSELVLEASTFSDCTAADGYGGAVAAVGTTLVARGTRFEANRASDLSGRPLDAGYGGAVVGSGADLAIDGCTFVGNEAHSVRDDGGYGAAVHAYESTVTVGASRFEDNVADELGSAISAWDSSLLIGGDRFVRNLVTDPDALSGNGGAVFCDTAATCTIDRAWFEGNVASDGAGVCATGALTLTTSMFCANRATSDGGAVDVGNHAGGDVTIDGNVVASNTAAGEGGGIVVTAGTIGVHNNHLVANEASQGAAVATVPSTGLDAIVLTSNLVAGNIGGDPVLELAGAVIGESWGWLDANVPTDLGVPLGEGTGEGPAGLRGPYASCDPSDLEPLGTSALVDAGDPAPDREDPDGTRNDIGAFGGPHGDRGAFVDGDGDGWASMVDCDDDDPSVHPAAEERCDGIDDDCDGLVDADDRATDAIWRRPDEDGDGIGTTAGSAWVCPSEPGWATEAGDCDDGDPGIAAPTTWYADGDGDGFGDPERAEVRCGGDGWSADGADCDDRDPGVHEGCGSTAGPVGPGDADGDGVADPVDPEPDDAGGGSADPPRPDLGFGCGVGPRPLAPAALLVALVALQRRRSLSR